MHRPGYCICDSCNAKRRSTLEGYLEPPVSNMAPLQGTTFELEWQPANLPGVQSSVLVKVSENILGNALVPPKYNVTAYPTRERVTWTVRWRPLGGFFESTAGNIALGLLPLSHQAQRELAERCALFFAEHATPPE